MSNVFVTAEIVKEQIDSGAALRFIDCRFDLMDVVKGEQQFHESHIEGAVYFHLERDLSDMTRKASGRHPMPEKSALIQLFETNGLRLEDTIYCYDNGAEPFAARGYWMLTFAGFTKVHIVNGGFQALVEAGLPTSSDLVAFERTNITPNWQDTIYATRQDVHAITKGDDDTILLDARAAKRYRGEFEPLDPVAGHIPTAQNFDWEQLKNGTALMVTDNLLRTISKDQSVVVYCGSGVTASPLYATLKEAGYDNVRLYVGSYSDWINEHNVEK